MTDNEKRIADVLAKTAEKLSNEACEVLIASMEGYASGYEAGKRDAMKEDETT